MAWTVGASCVLYVVHVTGWLGCFLGVRAPQNFKENVCIVHLRIYAYVVLFYVSFFLSFVCSQKANVYVIIDNKDSVFCIENSPLVQKPKT